MSDNQPITVDLAVCCKLIAASLRRFAFQDLCSVSIVIRGVFLIFTALRKASFASAVYATANPSIRLCVRHTVEAIYTIGYLASSEATQPIFANTAFTAR